MASSRFRGALLGAVLALLFLPVPGGAQILEIVPQIGGTLMQYGGDAIESSGELGFTAGGKVRIGSGTYLDGGLFWTYQGGRIDVASPINGTTSDVFYVRTVRVPVTVGIRLVQARLVNLRVFGGGVANFVAGTGDSDFGFSKDDLKRVNYGLRGGVGADILMIAVDVAYEYGITNVFEDEAGLGDVKQKGVVVEAGLRIAM
ncbi:MAG: hypothetical protein PVF05_06475 [Gemmatimonadales bacterium]|jgi:hypothetical protein